MSPDSLVLDSSPRSDALPFTPGRLPEYLLQAARFVVKLFSIGDGAIRLQARKLC